MYRINDCDKIFPILRSHRKEIYIAKKITIRESIKDLQKFNNEENQKAVLLVDGKSIICDPDFIYCKDIESDFDDSVISLTVGNAEIHGGNEIHKVETLVIPLSRIVAAGILSSAESEE